MRKVLVIGCGGSGAKTLAYMMDQIRADLAVHGIDRIPGCWQFLSVDTPIEEERGETVPSVSDQGGRYVSCGVRGSGYQTVDSALTRDLQAESTAGLRATASWMPRRAEDVDFPISVGAGQFRGIGRLVVLTKLAEIKGAVERAMAAMASPEARESARAAAAAVPGLGEAPSAAAPPLVLVASSMAGGSGASMTLDVCRLVAGTQGIDPQLISVFLYTAEVFASVPAGMRGGMPGNTLAMLGEIISAQSTSGGAASTADEQLYQLLGLPVSADRTFSRVIPIGLTSGADGAVFGDGTAEGVFRGMGRGLARYISSDAFDAYVQYNLANPLSGVRTDLVGWGADPNAIAWGSFGYASLSMGRDRYAEYAAQRLARRAVDHALDRFRRSGDSSGDSQRLASLWSHRSAEELSALGLPAAFGGSALAGGGGVDRAAMSWFLSADGLDEQTLRRAAQDAVAESMSRTPQVDPSTPVSEWADIMMQNLRTQEGAITGRLDAVAEDLTARWAQRLGERLVATTRQAIADLGLPYASYVLSQIGGPGGIARVLAQKIEGLSAIRPAAVLQPSSEFTSQVMGMRKATLGAAGTTQLQNNLAQQLSESAFQWLASRAARQAAGVLEDFCVSAVAPLEAVMDDARRGLQAARSAPAAGQGVAEVASDLYAAWPREPEAGQSTTAAVPKRFATAHNEVTIMDVAQYAPRFDADVLDSVAAERAGQPGESPTDLGQAYEWAVRDVLRGHWVPGSGEKAPENLLTVASVWVPSGLSGRSRTAMPQPARYELRVSPEAVLERARAFVGRRGESFETFVSESLREYLTDQSVGGHELSTREQAVLSALERALVMARPLTAIRTDIYTHLHAGAGDRPLIDYTFSAMPFANLPVAQRLVDAVERDDTIDSGLVADRIDKALGTEKVSRVDVFGSYPRTLPVAYSGLLESVLRAWDERRGSDAGRSAFWKWRRARPLPGGLPMGDSERRTLVRAWWLAQLAGGIQRPDRQGGDLQPVRVWDLTEDSWVDFPAPMLTPPSRMIVNNAWLPVVLESSLLAYVQAQRTGLDAFRPWKVLRTWADTSESGPIVSLGTTGPEEKLVGRLLAAGTLSDQLRPAVDLSATDDPEERRSALLSWIDAVLADLDQHYLPGPGKADGGASFTNFRKRAQVEITPLTIDLAQEMVEGLTQLRSVIAEAPVATDGEGGQGPASLGETMTY